MHVSMTRILAMILALGPVATPATAQTWDGAVTGKVSGIDTSSGNNLDFPVLSRRRVGLWLRYAKLRLYEPQL